MSITFQAEGLTGTYSLVGHTCDDLCVDYLPHGHVTCPGDWVEAGVNLANNNALAMLEALGLPRDYCGEVDAQDLADRVSVALLVGLPSAQAAPSMALPDASPWGCATFTGGRDAEYVARRLQGLAEVAAQALSLGVRVVWA